MATAFQEQQEGQAQYTGAFQASARVVLANVPPSRSGQLTAPDNTLHLSLGRIDDMDIL